MLRQKTPTAAAIFSEALANLAFMFTDEDVPEAPRGDPWLEITIGYRGPACGSLRFMCTRGFARLLAANLLAIDADDPAADARAVDAAKEFMSIFCGQVVTTLHDAEHIFEISIPECRPLATPPELDGAAEPGSCTLAVEGYPVRLVFVAHQQAQNQD